MYSFVHLKMIGRAKYQEAVETGFLTTYKFFLPQDIFEIPFCCRLFLLPTPSPASYCASLRNTVVSSGSVAQIWMHAAEPLISQTQHLFILGSSPPPHPRPLALATAALKMVKISTCTTVFLLGPQLLHWEYPLLKSTLVAYCKQV